MKVIHKKLTAVFTSLLLLSGSSLSLTASATYNYTSITNFSAPASISNTFTPLPSNQNPIRSKSTNSSVYIRIDSASNGAWVQTWGLVDTNWNNTCENVTLDSYNNKVNYVALNNGGNWVHNNVNEYGYGLCGLKFSSTAYYYTSTINGAWAPDC